MGMTGVYPSDLICVCVDVDVCVWLAGLMVQIYKGSYGDQVLYGSDLCKFMATNTHCNDQQRRNLWRTGIVDPATDVARPITTQKNVWPHQPKQLWHPIAFRRGSTRFDADPRTDPIFTFKDQSSLPLRMMVSQMWSLVQKPAPCKMALLVGVGIPPDLWLPNPIIGTALSLHAGKVNAQHCLKSGGDRGGTIGEQVGPRQRQLRRPQRSFHGIIIMCCRGMSY
jgi:hypothetical protein